MWLWICCIPSFIIFHQFQIIWRWKNMCCFELTNRNAYRQVPWKLYIDDTIYFFRKLIMTFNQRKMVWMVDKAALWSLSLGLSFDHEKILNYQWQMQYISSLNFGRKKWKLFQGKLLQINCDLSSPLEYLMFEIAFFLKYEVIWIISRFMRFARWMDPSVNQYGTQSASKS